MRIAEIFNGIDGEVNAWGQGTLTTFIRTAGCNLNCPYCDTKWTQDTSAGKEMLVDDIVQEIITNKTLKVTITGGEPFLQKDLEGLVKELQGLPVDISIETNGTLPIPDEIGTRANLIVDYKLQERKKFIWSNLIGMSRVDFIKFVVGSLQEVEEARMVMMEMDGMGAICRYAFSPLCQDILPGMLPLLSGIDLPISVNIQLHKLVGLR